MLNWIRNHVLCAGFVSVAHEPDMKITPFDPKTDLNLEAEWTAHVSLFRWWSIEVIQWRFQG
jgi:hypothetical protein